MTDDVKNAQRVQKLAFNYADNAIPTFSAQYSQTPKLGELAMFSGMAGATLLGTMYAVIHHNAGRDEADKWLMQYLSIIGTVVRAKNIPVQISVTVKTHDMGLADKELKPASNPLKLQQTCTCRLNPDGTCPSCPNRLKGMFKDMIDLMTGFQDKVEELKAKGSGQNRCDPCFAAYLDASFAGAIIGGAVGKVTRKDVARFDELYGFVSTMAQMAGVEETPLTMAAWAKMLAEAEDGAEAPGA